jgi:glutaredoxin 3
MNQVTLYGTNRCPFCIQAERLLQRKGVVPHKINIDNDDALEEEMVKRSGRRTVPQIFIGDLHVGGYDDLSALDRLGKLDALLRAEKVEG